MNAHRGSRFQITHRVERDAATVATRAFNRLTEQGLKTIHMTMFRMRPRQRTATEEL